MLEILFQRYFGIMNPTSTYVYTKKWLSTKTRGSPENFDKGSDTLNMKESIPI